MCSLCDYASAVCAGARAATLGNLWVMSPGSDRAGQRPCSDGDGPAAILGRGLGAASEAAFREYVTTRGSTLLRMALLLTGNRADAEDLLQAVLAKTYLAWDRIQDQAALDSYVKRAMSTPRSPRGGAAG